MLIERYFDLIEAKLGDNPIVTRWTLRTEKRGRTLGYLWADVRLRDSSRLHFREYVDVAQTVERLTYAYQFMTPDQSLIFRYDNVEHHPHIATYPHHKHDGSEVNVIASSAPTLDEVLAEIEDELLRGDESRV